MLAYHWIRAGARSALLLWLNTSLVFLLLRVVPGDATETTLRESGASAAVIAERRHALGLDAPVGEQYLNYWAKLARGDMGISLLDGQPVRDILVRALPHTAILAVGAFLIAGSIGVLVGTLRALAVSRLLRLLCSSWMTLSVSVPIFWSGTLALTLFAARLGWLPASGTSVAALMLPACVLGAQLSGSIAQIASAAVQDANAADFARTARAKGLRERRIVGAHLLRHALPAIVSISGLQLGYLLGGTAITEAVFNRPGLGRVLLDAALRGDTPVVQGVLLWSVSAFLAARWMSQRLAAWADPRLGAG